mgnify:CR=1 FL=1
MSVGRCSSNRCTDILEIHLISMCLIMQIVFTPYDSIDLVEDAAASLGCSSSWLLGHVRWMVQAEASGCMRVRLGDGSVLSDSERFSCSECYQDIHRT